MNDYTVHLSNETVVTPVLRRYVTGSGDDTTLSGMVNPRERMTDVPLGPLMGRVGLLPDVEALTLGELAYAAAWLANEGANRAVQSDDPGDRQPAVLRYAADVARIAHQVATEMGLCADFKRVLKEINETLESEGLPTLGTPTRQYDVVYTQTQQVDVDVEDCGLAVTIAVTRTREVTVHVDAANEAEARSKAHDAWTEDECENGDWDYDCDDASIESEREVAEQFSDVDSWDELDWESTSER